MRWRALVLAGVLILLAGCGGGKEAGPTAETVEGPVPAETAAEGDPEAGKSVFASAGCGGCHTFAPAGSTGTIGPNLDEVLEGQDPESVRESIVNPDAKVSEGFSAGVMPKNFSQKLSEQELADLVAFLTQKS